MTDLGSSHPCQVRFIVTMSKINYIPSVNRTFLICLSTPLNKMYYLHESEQVRLGPALAIRSGAKLSSEIILIKYFSNNLDENYHFIKKDYLHLIPHNIKLLIRHNYLHCKNQFSVTLVNHQISGTIDLQISNRTTFYLNNSNFKCQCHACSPLHNAQVV